VTLPAAHVSDPLAQLNFEWIDKWRGVGVGDPEGRIVAPVGATFQRSDGAAGSTFYVKESGAGNTGWVAK
jgi:hypothetical protein